MMRTLKLVCYICLIFGTLCFASPALQKRKYQIATEGKGACNPSQVSVITTELENVKEMAQYASEHFTDYNFYKEFFSEGSTSNPEFMTRAKKVLSSVSQMADPTSSDVTVPITCDQTSKSCEKNTWAAHMNPSTNTMNFCNFFFNDEVVRSTSAILNDCVLPNSDCMTLRDYRNTKAVVILHEFTHTNYGMGSPAVGAGPEPISEMKNPPYSIDVAYQVEDCVALAAGKFTRGKKYPDPKPNKGPVCPDKNNPNVEGVCDPELAEWTADNWALVAAQLWYSKKCGKVITLNAGPGGPPLPPLGTGIPGHGTGVDGIKMEKTMHVKDPKATTSSPTKHISKRFTYFSNATANVNARSATLDAPACKYTPQYIEMDEPILGDVPTNATQTAPATNTPAGTPLPCVNFADPDNSVSNYCTCNNGVKTPNAPGHTGNPCPWTKAPPVPTTAPKVWTTTPLQYPITTSFPNGETDECESYTTIYAAGFPVRKCASGNPGDIVTIHPSSTLTTSLSGPSVTVQAAKNPVPVGTMSSDELYTAISSAIDALCPTPTPGVNTTCNAGQQIIPNIDHVESGYWESDGEIAVEVLSSTYSDPGIREGMIKAAANSAMASANSTNCYTAYALNGWSGKRGLTPPEQEPRTLCNAGNFAGVQYFAPGGANTMWLSPSYSFEVAGGTFDCEMAMDALNSLLDLLGPEFAIADAEINNAIQAGCEAFLDHQ